MNIKHQPEVVADLRKLFEVEEFHQKNRKDTPTDTDKSWIDDNGNFYISRKLMSIDDVTQALGTYFIQNETAKRLDIAMDRQPKNWEFAYAHGWKQMQQKDPKSVEGIPEHMDAPLDKWPFFTFKVVEK